MTIPRKSSPLFDIALCYLCAVVLGAICYWNWWIFPNISYFDTDFYLDFLGSFLLTNFIYQGNVQLWDNFDQMPHAYFCLTYGVYKLPNVLTAITYTLCSPFSQEPAKLFTHVFAAVHFLSLLLLRVTGYYLFLQRFCPNRWLLIFATAYASITLSPLYFLSGLTFQSFYPLFLHLGLKFLEDFKIKDLLLLIVYFAVCLSYGIMQGGYMYQGVHMLIVPALAWSWMTQQQRLRDLGHHWRQTLRNLPWPMILLTLLCSTLIMAPDIYMAKYNLGDYSFGYADSRIDKIWNIPHYFRRPHAFCDPNEFLWKGLDFTNAYDWGQRWIFMGFTAFAFAAAGAVLGRDPRRHIFTAAIVLIWSLNHAKDAVPFGILAHWINAITNPINFIPRTLHIASVGVLPYLLAPLMVMGVQALWEALKAGKDAQKRTFQWKILIIILAALFVVPALQRPVIVPYLIIAGIIFGSVLIMAASKNRGRVWNSIAFVLISGLFICDIVLMSLYVKSNPFFYIKPVTIVGRPELKQVSIDYQNPRTLPYRSFYDVFQYRIPENSYLMNIPMNVPGIYFRYNNMLRHFFWTNNYMPRHISYANWQQDALMWNYIHAQRSQIFFASHAVETTDFNFQKIIEKGLIKDVVMIEPGKDVLLPHVPAIDASRDTFPLTSWDFTLKDCKRRAGKDLSVVQCKLPADFPKYMASTFLTADSATLTLPGFSPVQGQVVLPYTFDVNNMRDGWIVIGVPPEVSSTAHLTLSYPRLLPPGITKIFRNQSDRLGFDLKTDKPGWLVFQYPYDVKWHLRVDGKETQLRRANKSFLAAPLSAGEHTVELTYWPNTPLRWIILASVLLAFFDLIVVLYLIFRRST